MQAQARLQDLVKLFFKTVTRHSLWEEASELDIDLREFTLELMNLGCLKSFRGDLVRFKSDAAFLRM